MTPGVGQPCGTAVPPTATRGLCCSAFRPPGSNLAVARRWRLLWESRPLQRHFPICDTKCTSQHASCLCEFFAFSRPFFAYGVAQDLRWRRPRHEGASPGAGHDGPWPSRRRHERPTAAEQGRTQQGRSWRGRDIRCEQLASPAKTPYHLSTGAGARSGRTNC